MAIILQDGTGTGQGAKVNNNNRLLVQALTLPYSGGASVRDGDAYCWTSSYSASSGDEVIYIKNTSTEQVLILEDIQVSGVNAGLYELFEVTGTASGTTITGKNLNLTSGNVAAATALGNAAVTGITIGDRISLVRTPAATSKSFPVDSAIVLGLNDAIAITFTGTGGIVDVSVLGYFESGAHV